MTKKQTAYYYVLVFTQDGPRYVTKVDNADRTAYWNVEDKPYSMSAQYAKDLARGLTWNGNSSIVVISEWEVTSHPYNYEDYDCTFVKKEDK